MYQSLYRKYRPTNFDEVVGQKIIIQTLKNAVKNNQITHAYLFAGPRGTGKTSIAKILAKIINCENLDGYNPCDKCVNCTQYNNKQAVDIIEIDAASNNGVEEIRDLKSKITLVPTTGKYKIYIIDEVHMLSTGAFNALLKTLEEPPKHVIFILATTDPHKIPSTILSRCQRFDFKKIDNLDIIRRIKKIVNTENIKIEGKAIEEIAVLSDGGMRDALSLLDQAISYSEDQITLEDIYEINGTVTPDQMNLLLQNIISNNVEDVFRKIDQLNEQGKDFYKLTEEIIMYLRDILLSRLVPNYNNIHDNLNLKNDEVIIYIETFNKSLFEMKNSNNMKLIFELTIIKLLESVKKQKKEETEFLESVNVKKINSEQLNKIINVRINNTLSSFNKKEFLNFKNDIQKIQDYQFDKKYSDIVNLILDGEIKAFGKEYFIIVFPNAQLTTEFNNNIQLVDELMEITFKQQIHGVSVNNENWELIKKEFNSKEKVYQFIEEEKI